MSLDSSGNTISIESPNSTTSATLSPNSSRQNLPSVSPGTAARPTHSPFTTAPAHGPNALRPMSVYPASVGSANIIRARSFALHCQLGRGRAHRSEERNNKKTYV